MVCRTQFTDMRKKSLFGPSWNPVALGRLMLWTCMLISLSAQGQDKNSWPTPTSYAKDIPVYETFDELGPIFSLENDTTYIINFWATWCKPCVKELPYFEALNAKYAEEKVRVILVSLDFPKQIEQALVPFVERRKLQSTVLVLLDGSYNDWIDKVSPDWSGAIPGTYVYRGEQHQFLEASFENSEELEDFVSPFLSID